MLEIWAVVMKGSPEPHRSLISPFLCFHLNETLLHCLTRCVYFQMMDPSLMNLSCQMSTKQIPHQSLIMTERPALTMLFWGFFPCLSVSERQRWEKSQSSAALTKAGNRGVALQSSHFLRQLNEDAELLCMTLRSRLDSVSRCLSSSVIILGS